MDTDTLVLIMIVGTVVFSVISFYFVAMRQKMPKDRGMLMVVSIFLGIVASIIFAVALNDLFAVMGWF